MEIILTEGCICDSLTINGIDVNLYTDEMLKVLIDEILNKETNKELLLRHLTTIIDISGEYIENSHCVNCTFFECPSCEYNISSNVMTTYKGLIKVVTDSSDNCIITVEGKDINNFSIDEIRNIIISMVAASTNACLLWVLRDLVKFYGLYKFCYHCEECGDNVVEYKLKIKK